VQVPGIPRPGDDRLRQRGQQRPGLRAGAGQRRRRDLRAVAGQAGHQGVHAPPSDVALGQQHRDEPVGQQALADRLRRAGRHHRRRHPTTAGPPVPAPTVRHHPHDHLPVQLLPGHVLAQQRERLPALRAAIPTAGEVPEHLEPGQVRVIPPARARPRTPLAPPAVPATPAAAGLSTAGLSTTSRARTRPLRGPPEQHPLQNCQVSPHPVQLGVPLRNTRQQPGVVLPQPGVLLPKLPGQLHQLPVRLQRGSQRIPQRQIRTRLRQHRSRPSHGAQQI
jgi:hypothetical protein